MNISPRLRLTTFVDFLIRRRTPIFWAAVVITILAYFPAQRLSFNETIESMYADDDRHLTDYLDSKRWFGGDELVIIVYQDPELFETSGQARSIELAEKLSQIPGVQAHSTLNLAGQLAAIENPLLSRFFKKQMESIRKNAVELFRGILVGDDDLTTAVVLRLAPESHQERAVPRSQTIAEIRAVAKAAQEKFRDQFILSMKDHTNAKDYENLFAMHIIGEPVQVHDMFRYVAEDGRTLGWTSTGLLIAVILFFFRRIRWVVLPILIVHSALLWTKAILVISGIQLTMVSSILESLVTIIGVATVMHLSLVYCELRPRFDRIGALRETLTLLSTDVFWVCATTAIGFAAELSSHVFPVRSFGIIMTLGSMLVLVPMAMFLPGGILMGRRTADPNVGEVDRQLGRWLGILGGWIERHPWRLLSICIVVTVVSLVGMTRIRMETEFTKNFRKSSPIVTAIDFAEQNLGGAGVWEINFPAPHELTAEYLDQVRDLSTKLREIRDTKSDRRSLTKVMSVADGVDLLPDRILGIPISVPKRMEYLAIFEPEFASSLYNPHASRMRIALRARERQSAEQKERLIHEVERLARETFPATQPNEEPKATGLYVLLTFLVESLLGDQWGCFLWGAAGIVVMMTIAYRSLRIGLISLIPNLLPIALVIGTMGWLDLPINLGTAMISSVSMGLTVDASIFYLSSFRRMQADGMTFSEALHATQHETGRALIYSNIALILGFLVLALSHFIPLVYFGLLVSVAMIGGLVGNLVLLPLLIRATEGSAQKNRG